MFSRPQLPYSLLKSLRSLNSPHVRVLILPRPYYCNATINSQEKQQQCIIKKIIFGENWYRSLCTEQPLSSETTTEDDASKKAVPKKKQRKPHRAKIDFSATTMERNFITPVRAMNDFLLTPSELATLPKASRRSPYENEPPMDVYWRKDIEKKSLEVWGSLEALQKELLKRKQRDYEKANQVFSVKRAVKAFRRETEAKQAKDSGLSSGTGKVVITAVLINATNFLFKLFAWLYTGSHSMFSECIHSLADTANQLILCYGIHKSVQRADSDHPYGYTNMRYVASLISGVGIFCVGTGLSIYHGITGLLHPVEMEPFYWAFFILGGSLVSEGATLVLAVNSIRKGAKEQNMTFMDYVLRGRDPSVNVVLLEDFASVLGVAIAASCMGLTAYCGSPIPDAVGSLLVGGLLGSVASFIIYTNTAALVGRSIPDQRREEITQMLERDIMIRGIMDVKGIDIGNSLARFKAEIDIDGAQLSRAYLDKQDLTALLEELKKIESEEEVEAFIVKHGENIVDSLGAEIDRIERKLRSKFPEVRHCDLEIL